MLKIFDIMCFIVRKFVLFFFLIEFLFSFKILILFYLLSIVICYLFFLILFMNFDKKRGIIVIKICFFFFYVNKMIVRIVEKIVKYIDIRWYIFLLFIVLFFYFINIL